MRRGFLMQYAHKRLMAEMDTVKISNRQESWAGKPEGSQISAPDLHVKSVSGSWFPVEMGRTKSVY
jgi:hypothetical protein